MKENIISYILRTQEYFRYRKFTRKKYKSKADNVDLYILLCEECGFLWERVERYISKNRWVKYTDNTLPTIGKKRETCPDCKKC
tara:strand:+ start:1462 stop:1713 length:252 start_codon:yes stop_codon:yes gene_type:complete